MNITAKIKPSELPDNKHELIIMNDNGRLLDLYLTLDEIEDLEGELTTVIMELSKYRRALQREEF